MGQSSGTDWWSIVMGQSNGTEWWGIGMGQSNGTEWWDRMVEQRAFRFFFEGLSSTLSTTTMLVFVN